MYANKYTFTSLYHNDCAVTTVITEKLQYNVYCNSLISHTDPQLSKIFEKFKRNLIELFLSYGVVNKLKHLKENFTTFFFFFLVKPRLLKER